MACTNYKKPYYKSSLQTYNNTAQTVTEDLTTVNILGTICTDTGCAISTNINSVNLNCKGLYKISAYITFTPTTAGAFVAQLYNGTTPLPCAIAQETAEAGNIFTIPLGTELEFTPCCNAIPSISIKVSGVAGDVNWVGMTVRKDA